MGRTNKYKLNHNYFDKIDDEHKAYILGFIYADGNIPQNKYYIIIDISYEDVDLLNYVSSKLYEIPPKYTYRTIKDKKYCKLQISSKHMANILSNYGCIPNKTETLKFPSENDLPQKLQRHFIRGYFDGDGCHLEKEPNRFQRLKQTHPKLWEYCMKSTSEGGLGMKEILEYINVKSE